MKRVGQVVTILSLTLVAACVDGGIEKANTTLDAQLQEFRQLNKNFIDSQQQISNQMGQMTATIQKGSESIQSLSRSLEANSQQVSVFLEQAGKWSQVLAHMDPKNFEDMLGEVRGFMVAMNQAMPKLAIVLEKTDANWLSKIGQLADAAKVGTDMLRYYDLLPERQKPEVENEATDLLAQTTNAAGVLQQDTQQRINKAESILEDSKQKGISIPNLVVDLLKEFKETNTRLKALEKMGKSTLGIPSDTGKNRNGQRELSAIEVGQQYLQMAKMSPEELQKNYPGIQFMTTQLQSTQALVEKLDKAASKLKQNPMRGLIATLLGVAAK